MTTQGHRKIFDQYETVIFSESAHAENQDQANIFKDPQGLIFVIADGAGGSGGGRQAAERVVDSAHKIQISEKQFFHTDFWAGFLLKADRDVFLAENTGEATCIIAAIRDGIIIGASVGDSEAWDICGDKINDLTQWQQRKPLLGSGNAVPVTFGPVELQGTLLLASDGLFKYARLEKITGALCKTDIRECAEEMGNSVRLSSGALWDDITIMICRMMSE